MPRPISAVNSAAAVVGFVTDCVQRALQRKYRAHRSGARNSGYQRSLRVGCTTSIFVAVCVIQRGIHVNRLHGEGVDSARRDRFAHHKCTGDEGDSDSALRRGR